MTLFIIGIIVFFGIHLLPSCVETRQTLIGRLGELGYKAAFSGVSIAGFVLMLYGWKATPPIPVFEPPAMSLPLSKFVMLPAFVLFVAAYIPCRIRHRVGHPMIIAILLWALVHVLANGDLASLLLFGSFLLYSIVDWALVVRRQPAAPAAGSLRGDLIVVAVGIVAYFAVYFLHDRFLAPLA